MVKLFKVAGTDKGTICISVDGKSRTLSVNSDIQAEDIYKSLRYEPNDTYKFVDGGAGKVAQAPYEAFRDFLKEIVGQVNALATENSPEGVGPDAATPDASTQDAAKCSTMT